MKSLSILLVLYLVAILTGSCKKEDENPTVPENHYRLKEYIFYGESGIYRTVYTYNGEQITQSVSYKGTRSGTQNWEEYLKTEYVYEPNKITETLSFFDNGDWRPFLRSTLSYSGAQVTEWINYNFYINAWEPTEKESYTYSGNKLKTRVRYLSTNGVWNIQLSNELIYSDNRCTEYLGTSYYYGSNPYQIPWKGVFSYSGEKIAELVKYMKRSDSTWANDVKSIYQYQNGQLSGVKVYQWMENNNAWNSAEWSSTLYQYNSNGYLSRMDYTEGSAGMQYTEEYIYEAGLGNGQLLFNNPWDVIVGDPVIRKAVRRMPEFYPQSSPNGY
jgi:hypothetical protein